MFKLVHVCKMFLTVLSLLPITVAYTQSADTAFIEDAVINAHKLYREEIKGQTILYCGSEYPDPLLGEEEHPFFPADDWVYGSVVYHAQPYESVPLLYDASTDKVITENYYNAEEIVLMSEKLDAFEIGEHKFIKVDHTLVKGLPASGFYEQVYPGNTKVIVKRMKVFSDYIENQKILYRYDAKNKFYLLKNGAYFQVNSKNALLRVLSDQKQALRPYIKKNQIQFRTDPAVALKNIAAHYDDLISGK